MSKKEEKFLMLHVSNQDSRGVLMDAYEEGIHRGLIIENTKIGKYIREQFTELKNKGYFPVGMIVAEGDKLEFVFKRHPKQTKEMRMKEVPTENPLEL